MSGRDDDNMQGTPYGRRVGERLRAIRRQKRLSLQDVEAASGQEFKASVLGAYERGERVISVLRLQRLASFYRVPVDQVLPRHAAPPSGNGAEAAEQFIPKRPLTIDLVRLGQAESVEGQVVRRYVTAIQNERAGFHGPTMSIRAEDLQVLGRFLDRDAVSMEKRLAELGLRY